MAKQKEIVRPEIKIGTLIYSYKDDSMLVGAIVKNNEDKTFDVEWMVEGEPYITQEKEMTVRAGMFAMKCYKEAMGDTLPL